MKQKGLNEGVRFAFFGFHFAHKQCEREADCSEVDSDNIKCGECEKKRKWNALMMDSLPEKSVQD